ncbi:MAG: diguanylate cyclase domain-containing protein [Acidimicrobiales bacterium]
MNAGEATPAPGELYKSFVELSPLGYLAMRPDGTVVYASTGLGSILGREPTDLIGGNVVNWLHPDEVERALLQLAAGARDGVARGITRFRVRHADGGWVPTEIWATRLSDDPELYGICARDGRNQVFLEEIMAMLLQGAPRTDALIPVLHTIGWESAGSQVAIDWADSIGRHHVSTGNLADALTGASLSTEVGDGGPWAPARATLEAVRGSLADLDQTRRDLAEKAGLESFWIEPVLWSERHDAATVTVWTKAGLPPDVHSYGMAVARSLVELILRWTEQVHELDTQAKRDPLTGLYNRRAFFAELEQCTTGGAVLYCDLDKFKPVNDMFGHAAGDHLLELVAMRLRACLREGDILARLGGDEFAVLAPGASPEEGNAIGERIRAALGDSFALDDAVVSVGISIGVAHNPFLLNGRVLEEADFKLGAEKAVRQR